MCLAFACAKHILSVGLYEIPCLDSKVQSSLFVWCKGSDTLQSTWAYVGSPSVFGEMSSMNMVHSSTEIFV